MPERYKREIEEILRQAGELGNGKGPGSQRPGLLKLAWRHAVQSLGGKTWSISPGRVMLLAFSLLLAAVVVGSAVPGLIAPLAWLGLILLIVGYAMFFIRPPRIEKRWRGQKIDYDGDSWWDRLRRKIR